MLDREPFLKAVFADPDNDLPRLVFADYLEEQGETEWAELIRVQCELARRPAGTRPGGTLRRLIDRNRELVRAVRGFDPGTSPGLDRGFAVNDTIEIDSDGLYDPDGFRGRAAAEHPEWYGATRLKVVAGKIVFPVQLNTLLTSPVTAHVTDLDLSGREVESAATVFENGNDEGRSVVDIEIRPVVTVSMVELLTQSRDARRLTGLDLTNNDLDNVAARAIGRSPHLFRLGRLAFSRGNRFRGAVWQELVARFGEHVVE
jgi:uncharacterized protein (TIGR02996 family)